SEFLFRKPAALGEKSVVILCSSDDAKTLKAARFATEKRAITIGLSANKETLLRKEVSYFLRHDSQEVDSLINSLYSSLYLLTTGILQEREQNAYHDLYQGMIRNLDNIDIVLNKAKNYFKPIVDRFVETATWKRVFAISGGTNYSQVFYLATSKRIKEENIDVKAIHAGELANQQFNNIDKDHVMLFYIGLNKAKNYFKPIVDRFVETATWKRVFAISGGTNYSQVFYLATSKRIKEENIDVKAIHAGELANQQFNNIDKDHVMLFYIGL